jgi:cytochrome P450
MADPIQLPFEQSHPLEVAPTLRRLQSEGPVHRIRTRVGHDAWLVTGYEQVRSLLADDRLGRAHPDPDHAARSGESALFGGPLGNYDTEQADHARMRSLLQPHFSPKRMRELRPHVEALTGGLLGDLARRNPPVDLKRRWPCRCRSWSSVSSSVSPTRTARASANGPKPRPTSLIAPSLSQGTRRRQKTRRPHPRTGPAPNDQTRRPSLKFTLDPTRDFQPRGVPPGPPKRAP